MAWGASKSIDSLLERVQKDDSSLTSLHIFQGKVFGRQEASKLAQALQTNTHLIELYASGHELEPESVQAIAQAIGKSSTLRVLCLGNSTFGDENTAILAEGIASSSSLQRLDMESKSVGLPGIKALGKALGAGLALQSLLLARNALSNSGVEVLAQALAHSQVSELDIRDCGLTSEGCGALANAIADSKTLRVLRLDENAVGPDGAQLLAKSIPGSQLEELYLNNTSISDEGLGAIAQASAESSSLRVLEANGCGVGPEGAKLLADALKQGSSLRTIHLRDNSIGDEGAETLGKALVSKPALEELNLGKNQMGPGANRIFQGSLQLKKLNLEAAQLGDEGGIALANALTGFVQTSLQEIELSGCDIGDAGVKRLMEALHGYAAPALEVVLLAGNPGVADAGFAMQVDLLSTTRTELDIVWRGSCDAPPMAADGGPPKPAADPEWAQDPNDIQP